MRGNFTTVGTAESQELESRIEASLSFADSIVATLEREHRDPTDDEQFKFDAAMEVATDLQVKADNEKRRLAVAKSKAIARAQSQGQFQMPHLIEDGTMSATGLSLPNHIVPQMKAFKNDAEGKRKALAAANWWKALNCRLRGAPDERAEEIVASFGLDIRASMTEGSAGSGGYLVPEPLAAAIIEVRAQAGVIRRVAQREVMTSDTKDVPKLLSGPTVTYPGEAGEFTASDESWGQVNLSARKRGILTKVSRELRDDAVINVIDQLASRMGHEFALKEDAEGINGDGTSTYGGELGLLNAIGAGGVSTAATGHDTWGELDMADFTAWMAKLPSKYSPGAAIICSMNFYVSAMLRALAAAGGNSMVSLAQGVDMGLFLGKPVYFTDFMPTTSAAATVAALYGNFSDAMMLGDRQGIEIAVSDQRYFEFDLIGVRGVTRYDLNVHEPGDASNPGAYVALKTAS